MNAATPKAALQPETAEILRWLHDNADEKIRIGQARFGITPGRNLGIAVPALREASKSYRNHHSVALELWESGIHEARIMASMIASPKLFTPDEMDRWVAELDSWDICDQCCSNLFRKTAFAEDKIYGYAEDCREYVRRTAFVLIAVLAVHDKSIPDSRFADYLRLAAKHSTDDRNFVMKAVNWAIRQIGKRNMPLNAAATKTAADLAGSDNATARRTGKAALRELSSPKTVAFIAAHRK